MTSSIKPEVHSASQRRLRRIEPRPEVTSAKVVNTALQFRRYARGQNEGEHKETCALKHCALPHRGRSKDRSERTKQRCRVVYNADKRAFVYVCMYVCMCVFNIHYMRQTHTSNKKNTKAHSHYRRVRKCPSRTQCAPTGACVRVCTRIHARISGVNGT